jgi:hypothetical protein
MSVTIDQSAANIFLQIYISWTYFGCFSSILVTYCFTLKHLASTENPKTQDIGKGGVMETM